MFDVGDEILRAVCFEVGGGGVVVHGGVSVRFPIGSRTLRRC